MGSTVKLARTIGLKTLVILSLSSMLGSDLFLLPAFAQEVAGPGMWFAFLLAGSVVIASAIIYRNGIGRRAVSNTGESSDER